MRGAGGGRSRPRPEPCLPALLHRAERPGACVLTAGRMCPPALAAEAMESLSGWPKLRVLVHYCERTPGINFFFFMFFRFMAWPK